MISRYPKIPRTPRRKAGNTPLQGVVKRTGIKREAVEYDDDDDDDSPSKKSKNNSQSPRLIIGIDFGTTFSGVATVYSEESPEDIYVITDWPGNEDVKHKVCWTIEDKNDESEDRAWGNQVTSDMDCSSWFKLKMAPTNTSAIHDDPLLFQSVGPGLLRVPPGETPEKAIRNAMVDSAQIQVVLTTPADWDRKYKLTLREAVKAADIASRVGDTISTVDEPEAAALAAFETSRKLKKHSIFKLNTNIVVVDIGGGTIDIITYNVVQKDPLKVEEACAGTGAKCGSTAIDRELHNLMESKYGSAFSDLSVKETGRGSKFMESFEVIKRKFKIHGPWYRTQKGIQSRPVYGIS
ncbi:hypothetical protein AJ79_02769 [Helicocarpus griseus UAMH5409]|uniref:Hsp70-like protein n=1 Tax=Helicocarpus griseus UAMH5409 TaxID=1447875 RepID=A0A2B7Y0B2_9EURO|nr:hypothetical protein AJ79_02769 [Helicocarpus griseus UAMH5409]